MAFLPPPSVLLLPQRFPRRSARSPQPSPGAAWRRQPRAVLGERAASAGTGTARAAKRAEAGGGARVERGPSWPPRGDAHLPAEAAARAAAGSKVEKVKLAKDGSAMWTEVWELAALLRAGETRWEDLGLDDIDMRMKWAGLFHRRKRTPGRFMMRLKVPNGLLDSDQLRYFAHVLQRLGDGACGDITTRMNIQLRGMTLNDADWIMDGLYRVGLTSFMSGMDNVRNMVGSPIAGIDPLEMIDTRELCRAVNDMITGHRRGRAELTNLPRKFNIAISGSRDDFAHTSINDIGLRPALHPETQEMGFNVVVGGFFSIKRYAESIPMDVWLPPRDVVSFCEAVLLHFRDHGDRKNRQKSRLMWMLDQWGIEKFRADIAERMGVELRGAAPEPAGAEGAAGTFGRRDIQGVHPQKQAGYSWVCANVPAGRLQAGDFEELAAVADRYSLGEVRLTVEQNVLFPNVRNEDLAAMLSAPLFGRFAVRPGPLAGGLVSCTGSQFCGVALIETKNRALELTRALEARLALPRPVRVHWTGCPNSCGQAQVGDIGLMGAPARKAGRAVEGVHIYLGGRVGEASRLGTRVRKNVPCDLEDLVPAMTELLVQHFGATVKP